MFADNFILFPRVMFIVSPFSVNEWNYMIVLVIFRFMPRLAGSRSISEDSVFKPEMKDSQIGMLQGQAVSMENIDTNSQIQVK